MITYEMHLYNTGNRLSNRLMELVRLMKLTGDEKGWHIALHQHEDVCEVDYVAAGRGEYVIDSVTYAIGAGDLIITNCRTPHEERSDPEDPLVSYKMTLRMSPMGEKEANVILPKGISPVIHTGADGAEYEVCCQNLVRELSEKRTGYETMAVILASRAYLLAERYIESCGTPIKVRELSLAMRVKQYIDLNYAEKITLDILAKKLRASKYYICHEMRKEYNCAPIDYLINRRMGEADNLLNTTDLTIGEIARKVGYDNISYFNSLFVKRNGMTPSEFRARNLRMIQDTESH